MTAAPWALLLALLVGCAPRVWVKPAGDPDKGVNVTWWGHSCFSVTDSVGRTLLIDPFDESVGYDRPPTRVDAVLVTHDHFDHNDAPPGVVRVSTAGWHTAAGVEVTGVGTDHDAENGRRHGKNLMFVWSMGGLRLAHLGDIGQEVFTVEQKEALKGVDVLFVPVGGHTTVDARGAWSLARKTSAWAVVPMHYGHPMLRFYPLDPVDPFLALATDVTRCPGPDFEIKRSDRFSSPRVFLPTWVDPRSSKKLLKATPPREHGARSSR